MFNNEIIVFSHLRWEFVYQRPQQLLERFSHTNKILFVEEPISPEMSDNTKIFKVNQNITVIQPRIMTSYLFKELSEIVKKNLPQTTLAKPILWFYSAAFQKIMSELSYSLIVYDCMDELSAFKNASPKLIEEEQILLKKADIVFTGGKSLFEAKKQFATNIYCFPSSVDKAHFAASDMISTPADVADIKNPVIGYYGVIDERIDLDLLADIADLCSNYIFLMVGPVVKIEQTKLPKKCNIKYLGFKSYEELPAYLHCFDIAMMPFALNQATKFISPTKTLEYMAALKPIISTPIYDVARDYQQVVKIVNSAENFKQAIDYYLNEPREQKNNRLRLQESVINNTSWFQTAKKMQRIIYEVLSAKKHKLEPVL